MDTVLVTGAEGFAGRFVLSALQKKGYEVVAGVRNRARKLAHERQGGHALVCNVADSISVARVVAAVRPDAIIHLAGIARASDAADEPLEAYQSIVSAWANVLDAVRRMVPRAKVVLASACDVYGDAGRDGCALREDTPPQPVSTFGSLKLAAETLAHMFFRDYHLNVSVVRPFHYSGPQQPERFLYGAIAHRLAECEEGPTAHEFWLPDLSCRRDLMHVEDLAAAYERVLADGRPDAVYNICSGQAITIREVVMSVAQELGRNVDLSELPTPENEVQVLCWHGDNAKLRELGWTPEHAAEDALRDLARSYAPSPQPETVLA